MQEQHVINGARGEDVACCCGEGDEERYPGFAELNVIGDADDHAGKLGLYEAVVNC
jgi:hypothetical protein